MWGDVFEILWLRVIILCIAAGLLVALVAASWSCAKSYFETGRLQGMEEATREIVRGLNSHYELEGRTISERVTKAVEGIKAVSQKRWKAGKRATDPYHAQLWIFALEGTLAIAKIEGAIPTEERAFAEVQLKSQQRLIRDWWRALHG
jgi:hypothetical protein